MAVTPAILPLNKRLSYKQAKAIVVVAVSLGILSSSLQIYTDFFIFQQDVDDSLKQLIETVKRPATQAITNRDEKLASEVLEGLLQYNAVVKIELFDENKQVMTESRERGKSVQIYGRQFLEIFFDSHREMLHPLYIRDTGKFGVLKMTLDNHLIVSRSLNRATVILMSDLARNLLLAVFVLVLFHYIVTKPLFKIATDLGTIDLSNPDTNRLSYLYHHDEDELGVLVNSINQLLSEIDAQTAERERILQEMAVARQAAEVASLAKTEFLTNMSHEMRTPLNAVLNMLLLAQETRLTALQQDFLETASHSGKILLSLIDDILDFSKVEAKELDIEPVPFELRQVVEEAVSALAQQAEDKQLTLVSLITVEVPYQVKGDPKRLRQVVTNLINNAIKFTAEGEIIVSVSVAEMDAQKVTIRCEVTDTGIGVPAHAQANIFKLFEQVDGSTTRRYGGTGLGLALCQQIVQRMEGEIGVESTVGKGSTFWFTVNLELLSDGQLRLLSQSTEKWRVLVVDSHLKVQYSLDYYLRAWGLEVVCAENAQQALVYLRSAIQTATPFNIALLDLTLPDLDGISLGLALKADTRFVNIHLILLTPHHFHLQTSQIFSAYLRKPIRQENLHTTISKALSFP